MPNSDKSCCAMLVNTVTATSLGRCAVFATASRAASIILRPPSACTFTIHTPNAAAALHACAVVLGMS